MRIAAILSHITAALIYLQLVTGGPFALIPYYFTSETPLGGYHFIFGLIAGILGIIVVIAAWLSKPAFKAFRYTSTIILVLLFLVGFTSDKSAMNGILIHYEIAVLLFGAAIAGTFYAVRWNRMPKPAVAPKVTPE